MSRLYVVARTHREFELWCLDRDLNPRDSVFRYVSRLDHLRGTRGATVLLLPGWLDRDDWRGIYEMLLIIEAKVVGV